ncbi:cytochrome p450 monooxygenase [Diplodia corticola]|uniref:Cytochrome p450 monooxygenase n=1 Tax=Diplodia corticola TaxID=236234 RepID=A0A1J9SKB5_9PEZI|nr:cytochrome p450 monooxygenase [Diplodia corticola]OJD40783.1 cytochrome p450 monooxygenase [Diplodia corticola]
MSSAVKEIYWDAKCNTKAPLYGTGALGPPHLFTTLDGEEHRALRKALGGSQWTIGGLKNAWEPRIDELVQLFIRRMTERVEKNETVIISDKVAEFAADIMTMLSFSEPWGFVRNSRDERNMLRSWRDGLDFFGFVGRFRWFRDVVMKTRWGLYFLPTVSDDSGMGFLMSQADKQVSERERRIEDEGFTQQKPDFLQHCLTARHPTTAAPLTPLQKRAHITLLIQAGADTTGTALGSTLRFLLTHPRCLARCRAELATAASTLSSPIQYDETRRHLPYFVACIKESLRLNPPATNLFARVVPEGGRVLSVTGGGSSSSSSAEGVLVPAGAEVTCHAYVVQRDPRLYGPDPESYRPERWVVGEGDEEGRRRVAEMEAASFVFGVGPRVCLGKDVAVLEMWKLLPEIVRRFDLELVKEGRYVVAGGVAYNKGLEVRMRLRQEKV